MKTMRKVFFLMSALLFLPSCDILDFDELFGGSSSNDSSSGGGNSGDGNSGDGNSGGGSSGSGYAWERSDGTNTYLRFSGTTAYSCIGGNLTIGTYSASDRTMTFRPSTTTLVFPLTFYSNRLVVGAPKGFEQYYDEQEYYPSSTFPCSGSGSGGGGNSGGGSSGGGSSGGGSSGGGNSGGGSSGNTTGKVTFWTPSDLGCGYIYVSIYGQSGTISGYYSSGSPGVCDAEMCANFALPAGSHAFSASCGNYTWNGTANITNGGCLLFQLTD